MHSKNGTDKSVPYIKRLDRIGQAFYIASMIVVIANHKLPIAPVENNMEKK